MWCQRDLDSLLFLFKWDLVFHVLTLLFNPRCCPEGVVVNGQLIGSKQVQKSKLKTYFGTISVYTQPDGVSVTVSTVSIAMTDGRNNHSFTWGATAEITQDG